MFKVLIADDEPKIRKGLKQWIEESSYKFQVVAEAKNGKEALEYTIKASPELFLVDINMPMMNGLDFISQMKKISPNSIVVIITGYDDFQYAHKAIKFNVFDYLLKPVSKNEFNNLLRKVTETLGNRADEAEVMEVTTEKNAAYSSMIRSVKDYIDDHFDDSQLDLSHIAQLFDTSKSYISKRMKQELGKSFVEYLTDIRLEKAKKILENHHARMTMYHVSTRVGYTSQHYFSRVFKKTYGISPMEYRNKFNKL
ncbi:response regulator receiver protein [Alkaliphilus metalliredigens QYMF]|uniref:Stage 0 sporulation protein A homolog n=1 Tax=Alkaliphilus metalliredigens (strain QYMF) TaxID=293826 RepID=A6TMD1_ALKMQ|nr:response regulator [Alkaliphilus metalliredigens]ABR47349.1 response regulator receiver protein [Alkaliphilus metalliredigens QYMF]